MAAQYDICVDFETLCTLEDKLKTISYNLHQSTSEMVSSLQKSQEFLSGNQFEKARRTTLDCIDITGKTSNNISNTIAYINRLKEILIRYSMYEYSDGEK